MGWHGNTLKTAKDYYINRAISRYAYDIKKIQDYFDTFPAGREGGIWSDQSANGGSAGVAGNVVAGGAMNLQSGTTVNGVGAVVLTNLAQENAANFWPGSSGAWYAAFRFKWINNAQDATTEGSLWGRENVTTGNPMFRIGILGDISTTKFSAAIGGVSALSSISIDANAHTAEIWGVSGSASAFSFDEETPVSLAAALASPCGFAMKSFRGGTAANRFLSVDWVLGIAEGM